MLGGELVFDRRNDARDPTDGWVLTARALRGLGGSIAISEHETEEPTSSPGGPTLEVVPKRRLPTSFTTGLLDLRRYTRLGPDSELGLRFLWAGSLDGNPLPPQFQQALGGEGSLPGYGLLSQDCGARSRLYSRVRGEGDDVTSEPVFAQYGCDRAAILQLEYRGRLGFDVNFEPDEDEEWEWYPAVDLSPSWAFFFDVGKGWSRSDPLLDTAWISDVGIGFFLGNLGLYGAVPLRGENRGVNFFVRLNRRF